MSKKGPKKHLDTVVEFYQPLDYSKAPPCLTKVAASLDGQRMSLRDALNAVKAQIPHIPLVGGEHADVSYYKSYTLFRRWTRNGWIGITVKEEGRRKWGWEVIRFKRPK